MMKAKIIIFCKYFHQKTTFYSFSVSFFRYSLLVFIECLICFASAFFRRGLKTIKISQPKPEVGLQYFCVRWLEALAYSSSGIMSL